MDTEEIETTENNEPEQVEQAPIPETLVIKRRGRPTGSRNKAKEGGTGGTPVTAATAPVVPTPPPDMYSALMKRLDAMDGALEKRQKEIKKERAPRKVAIAPPPPESLERRTTTEPFRIQGSPRTASRQLMEHLHSQQMERASAREQMYQNFLPI